MPATRSVWLATVLLTVALGGCTVTPPHQHHQPNTTEPANPVNTTPSFTKEQALAQVTNDAKQIVAVAQLQNPQGNSWFGSCNDQGDPPYKGIAVMIFDRPADIDEVSFYQQIAAAMAANGWIDGSPPGRHHHGTTLHKEGVTAVFDRNPGRGNIGEISLYGECRIAGPKRLGSAALPIDFTS